MRKPILVAATATFCWWNTTSNPLLHHLSLNIMLVCGVSTLVFNANPLLRYDGYYILSDLLDAPNLWDESRNLWWVAVLSYGEGWHNNHHAHPKLARAGHRWWEVDPTWYAIKVLRLFGQAYDVDDRVPAVRKPATPAGAEPQLGSCGRAHAPGNRKAGRPCRSTASPGAERNALHLRSLPPGS